MLRYRIASMSDDEIRLTYAAAEVEHARIKKLIESAEEQRQAEEAALETACARDMEDVVKRARGSKNCSPGGIVSVAGAFGSGPPSFNEVYEGMILGRCAFAQTISAARDLGCLPPN